ncbi:MAG: phosphomannomutase/phosphoglucomutase [Anaerolineales bacterium]|nr:phosphomannomutase/phosphoglucomutase [Anaerolineales bacterium]
MANLEPTMFREYDLRGKVSESQLNEQSVSIIARAYGTMLQKRGIGEAVVAHDLRTGSKELTQVAVEALRSTGTNVIFIGQALTPMMYSAQYYYNTRGGMMVTASHNPNGWLGFKLALGLSYTLGPAEMEELRQFTISEEFACGEGGLRQEDYLPFFTRDLISRVHLARPVRVLVNAGNGTAGPIVPDILRQAGCQVFEFLTEPDLQFKHYFPNPALEKMMQDTGEQTIKHRAEIGLAIDGDGDRLGTTDELGNVVWPDRYLILLSRLVLKDNPGAPIVFDVKCTRALSQDILIHGGKPVLWKTGHSYIKEKLHQIQAPLAGEVSGHIFFGAPLYYGFDDAVFTALKLVEMLSLQPSSYSELIAETPVYHSTPTLQAGCDDTLKYQVVAELVQELQEEGYRVITFEDLKLGGRVEFEDGWGLVRASSNLPVLVLRFEATSPQRLEEIVGLFRRKLERFPQVSREWESG